MGPGKGLGHSLWTAGPPTTPWLHRAPCLCAPPELALCSHPPSHPASPPAPVFLIPRSPPPPRFLPSLLSTSLCWGGRPLWSRGTWWRTGRPSPYPFPPHPQHSDSQTCPFCRREIKGQEAVSIRFQVRPAEARAAAEDLRESSDQEDGEEELGQVSRARRELGLDSWG